jgi:DNA-binding transcriptional LysR family regulator
MINLDDLRFVAALSQTGSLSAAARALDVTPPALSMRLKKLEASLGAALVVRSSRRLRFTSEGERLVEEAKAVLGRIDALSDTLRQDGFSGSLRVVAPFGFGRVHIAPLLASFAAAHPQVRPTLDLSESPWSQAVDADVVIHIGAVRDSTWVGHVLARNARWVVAAPAYLKARGTPSRPEELQDHACLCVRENAEDVTLWRFRPNGRHGGRAETVRITPAMTSNNGEVVRDWALRGLGIALRSEWDVAPHVRAGTLKRLLPSYEIDGADVLALVPARRGISARVTRFVETMKAHFHPKPPWRG